MMKPRPYLYLLISLSIIISLSSSLYAAGPGGGGIDVRQTRIVFDAEKDQGKCVQFGVKNSSNEDMVIKIERADYSIADDGAFQIKEAGSTPSSANGFITCEEPEFIMKPGDDVTFDVTLKPDMEYILPEYISTILVRYIPKSVLDTEANIKTYTQVAISVQVLSGSLIKNTIDTSEPTLTIIDISGNRFMGYGGKKDIKLTLTNSGLITVEPKIIAFVDSIFSGRIEEIPDISGYIMPGQTRTFILPVATTSIFDIRTITINYEYQYADMQFTDACSFTYIVLSYQLVIGLLLLIAGIVWQARLFRKRNKLLKQLLEQNKTLAEAAAAKDPQHEDNKPAPETAQSENT